MPLAVLEAMASGRPIVASAVDGVKELIVDGEHGLLVEPENAAALARSVRAVADDPTRARLMGAAARRRVYERFDHSVITKQWEQLFQELCAEGGSAGAG
jgi:glycosyltransferase involved in cell wall biosynthesis